MGTGTGGTSPAVSPNLRDGNKESGFSANEKGTTRQSPQPSRASRTEHHARARG
jgi:hypothetical protein